MCFIEDDNGRTVELEEVFITVGGETYRKEAVLPCPPFRGGGSSRDVIMFFNGETCSRLDVPWLSFINPHDAAVAYFEILQAVSTHNDVAEFKLLQMSR